MDYLSEQLKTNTMRRVHALHAFRTMIPLAIEAVILGAIVWALTMFVSFSHVFSNMPATLNVSNHMSFALSAVMNTELPVLVLFFLALGLFIMAVRSVKNLLEPTWSTQAVAFKRLNRAEMNP